MSEANKQQIGGTHYKTQYEHWDWVIDMGLGYLEGCATKYVSRWRKKDGEKDLRKAVHYVNKLIEAKMEGRVEPRRIKDNRVVLLERFAEANQLSFDERWVCEAVAFWDCGEHLADARDMLLAMLEAEDRGAAPVPLEDSNKHADRAGSTDGNT